MRDTPGRFLAKPQLGAGQPTHRRCGRTAQRALALWLCSTGPWPEKLPQPDASRNARSPPRDIPNLRYSGVPPQSQRPFVTVNSKVMSVTKDGEAAGPYYDCHVNSMLADRQRFDHQKLTFGHRRANGFSVGNARGAIKNGRIIIMVGQGVAEHGRVEQVRRVLWIGQSGDGHAVNGAARLRNQHSTPLPPPRAARPRSNR